MRLDEFDQAEGEEGFLYELGRGLVAVVDVPEPPHLAQVEATRDQFSAYKLAYPGRIFAIAGGGECKILLAGLQTERHPDLAIYMTRPPKRKSVWSKWVPEVVIEIVSLGSEQRDYEEKPLEYFAFGVKEYWILDAAKEEMLVLRRSGSRWVRRIVRPPETYRTRLLPGLEFACAPVFAAARLGDE
jgi:Uma2 family endonuclease